MPAIKKMVTLDVAKKNLIQAIVAKQYDYDSRFIGVTLVNDGVQISVPTTATAVINARRADGEAKAFMCEVNGDGTITAPLTGWMLALDDLVSCSISVYGADEQKLSSTSFTLDVQAAEYAGDDISQDENYDILIELIADVSGAVTACETATGAANAAATLANTKAGLADTAATSANSAASSANTAAGAANSAATVANNAAADANTKAGAANTAAGAANTAAARANTAAAAVEGGISAFVVENGSGNYLVSLKIVNGKTQVHYEQMEE